jgi:hypothetical protein
MKVFIISILFVVFAFSQTTYNQKINNVFYPWINTGDINTNVLGGKKGGADGSSGYKTLWASGYGISGFLDGNPNDLRASWQQQANSMTDFNSGTWDAQDQNSPIIVYNPNDPDGKTKWAKAVELGAEYIDVDNNGEYDPNIDQPNLYGSEMFYMVVSERKSSSQRYFGGFPLGVEIGITGFAFSRDGYLGNVVYLKYKFTNKGDKDIKDAIFTIVVDPDVSNASDDRIGCDTVFTLSDGSKVDNLGYCYNGVSDGTNGIFAIDFFQGPVVNGDPTDTAFVRRGLLGVEKIPGMRNAKMNSYMFFNQAQSNSDPFGPPSGDANGLLVARRYMEGGQTQQGNPIDPTIVGTGGTAGTDNNFMFSGDPVQGNGWIMTDNNDRRFMQSTEAFDLNVGESQEIVAGYLYGEAPQGASNPTVDGITEVRKADVFAQSVFDANFAAASSPPPALVEFKEMSDGSIKMYVDLKSNKTRLYSLPSDAFGDSWKYAGIKVYQVDNSTFDLVRTNGSIASTELSSFVMNDTASHLLKYDGVEIKKVFESAEIHPESRNILALDLSKDQFTGNNFVKGRNYYYVIEAFAYNTSKLKKQVENFYITEFVSGTQGYSFQYGEESNKPLTTPIVNTGNDAFFSVEYVKEADLTGDDYRIDFLAGSGGSTLWRMTNVSTNLILLDTQSTYYDFTKPQEYYDFPIVQGVQVRLRKYAIGEIGKPDLMDWSTRPYNYSTWQGTTQMNGQLEIRYVAGSADQKDVTVVLEENLGGIDIKDTLFHGKAFFNPSTGVPLFVLDKGVNSSASNVTHRAGLSTVPFEIWHLGADLNNPSDDYQIWTAANYGRPSGGGSLFSLLDPVNYPENIYDGNDLAKVYTGGTLRNDSDKIKIYWGFPANRDDWVARYHAAYEVDADGGKGKSSRLYFSNPYSDPITFSTKKDLYVGQSQRKSELDKAKVVPNPYLGTHVDERNQNETFVEFTHLGKNTTVRIFTLDGRLVRTLIKNDNLEVLKWDLKNRAGIIVAPGLYIGHIKEEGVGEKILKFVVLTHRQIVRRF